MALKTDMIGKVKWFDAKKGFGFIAPDDGSEELFVHHSQIQMKGYRDLQTGQRVEFEIQPAAKGPRGISVRPINPVESPK